MQIPFSDEELKPAVTRVLDRVRPMLEKDRGGVDLIAIKNGKIYVQLLGGCVGCASANTTLKFTIERAMQSDIHPLLQVVNVPIGMEDKLGDLS